MLTAYAEEVTLSLSPKISCWVFFFCPTTQQRGAHVPFLLSFIIIPTLFFIIIIVLRQIQKLKQIIKCHYSSISSLLHTNVDE
jgi:hypothetical protein